MAITSSVEDTSHENDENNSESEHKQEVKKWSFVEKSYGRREGDHIPLIHAVVSHLAKVAMIIRKKKTLEDVQKETIQAKKKSFSGTSRKRRRGSSKTVLHNQLTATISVGNPTRYDRIWE